MSTTSPLYAVYPGTVTLRDGSTKSWTAAALAAAYGLTTQPYRTITGAFPQDGTEINYIHLKPRPDDTYQSIIYTAEDDGQVESYRPDFDGDKKYIQETNPNSLEDIDDYDLSDHTNG